MTCLTKTCLTKRTLLALVLFALSASWTPAEAANKEVVSFRLASWKAVHFKDEKEAKANHDFLKRLGCDVKQHEHDDHVDVQYRCPKWRNVTLKTHSSAHKMEAWLKKYGFETKHTH
ncbi:MAG: hypothetical protein QGG36_08800 [Pirellulaceae bacterium]|jgi:hypothetical protein|nr:hypothetical protein [Pirellulaceae bacterium]MDP7015885.1 hypothetical protein [Pirellulaceae bacterium]